jgi:hypothetical protein
MLHKCEMSNRIAVYISLFVLAIVISGCSQKNYPPSTVIYLSGTYETNISPFGLTSTKIVFENKDTCTFTHSKHMLEPFPFKGTYLVSNSYLYIRLIEPEEIPNEFDPTWTNLEYFKKFQLKEENNVEYHLKFLIEDEKLYGYNVESNELVKEALTYTEEKGKHMVPYYLEKKSSENLKYVN